MTTITHPTKSEIFSVYNKARKAARQGKLDEDRLNRALGLIQRKDGGARPYMTTAKTCTCPDFTRTGKPCKHIIKNWMQIRIEQVAPLAA